MHSSWLVLGIDPFLFIFRRLKFEVSSSSDSEHEEQQSSTMTFYNDDPELPVFSNVITGYPAEQVVRILMDPELDQDKVCHVQPMGVTKNASFIIDVDDVHFADLKADDLGSWKPNGTKTTYFRILPSGTMRILSGRPKVVTQSTSYLLTRRYYVYSTYHLFRRTIIDIQGEVSCPLLKELSAHVLLHFWCKWSWFNLLLKKLNSVHRQGLKSIRQVSVPTGSVV